MDKQSAEDFFSKAKVVAKSDIEDLAQITHDQVFSGTDCLSCGNCCKSAPPIVTPRDIKRIARFLQSTPKQILRDYTIQDINGELSFKQVPCTFLGTDNYCSIYEARPEACRDYPHTKSGNFIRRKSLHLANLSICPAVEEILEVMNSKMRDFDSDRSTPA